MSRRFKLILILIIGILIGGIALGITQYFMKKTSTTEFCVSCHSMTYPQQEWEGSVHFSNQKGIRAECADCHIPQDTAFHYMKTKIMALKDVWNTVVVDKLPDQEAFEKHRLTMAQQVWAEMKANDSVTCKSCHTIDAMELSEQSASAQKMHKIAVETQQTCIDCHKGIVHFMPEIEQDTSATTDQLSHSAGQFTTNDKVLYALAMTKAQLLAGGEVRLMPYAELTDWQQHDDQVTATLSGWQQVGAESIIYSQLGKRIMLALLDDDVKTKIKVIKSVHDQVTDSEWKQVTLELKLPKQAVTANLTALNQFGHQLNESYCSGCHAPISADHYTANQWIGIINSMKDRTSMSADDVRTVTIYLQRNAKDMGNTH